MNVTEGGIVGEGDSNSSANSNSNSKNKKTGHTFYFETVG
jgi:hypothetical protein